MKIRRRLLPSTPWPVPFGNVRQWIVLFTMLWSSWAFGQTALWVEGFEQDDYWDRWHVEGATWAVGVPTSGPNRSFAGVRCAATVLNGDYAPRADSRLVRDQVFTVPPAAENPRLRFWHWFRGAAGASRSVEVKVGTQAWQPIAAISGWESESWARAAFDLSPFSGQTVQIAFRFQSNADLAVAAGWYLDEVTVETGQLNSGFLGTPEGFESGLGNWTVDHGLWQIGAPTYGPSRVPAGTNCAGTILAGNYQPNADSRLISPEFMVPMAGENPRLRFWHSFSIWPGEVAQVEISVNGGAWEAISKSFVMNSVVWSRPLLDLRPFGGQSAQIAFHFQSNSDPNIAAGWYLDEVVIETGPYDWDPVTQPEGFESGMGNWSVESGTWEEGKPSFGPTEAFEGNRCAGTLLGGTYAGNVDSRLISPEFTVRPAADRPRLRFWHWLRNQPEDPASVEIRIVGSDWRALSGPIVANDGSWARPEYALSEYAGQRVQIAFRMQSNDDTQIGPGWYIDNVSVEIGPAKSQFIGTAEGFELGLGDWAIDKGTWEVGAPDEWPDRAFSGSHCAGTVLKGNYRPAIDSRLISPEFEVPPAWAHPRLRFWHWFSTWPEDVGTVEISVAEGPWQALSAPVKGSGVIWSRPWLDLRPFAGQRARVAFRFQSSPDQNVARGWYIDEVIVETGRSDLDSFNRGEGFEQGLGNWSAESGTWESGAPRSGPGKAFNGANCAATVLGLGGKYVPNTDSRLVSPEFAVPCAEASPRLRFAQWYDIAPGDDATVEIRVAGGPWEPVLGPIDGLSGEWIAGFYDLSSYAGRRVQIGFRFRANDDTEVSSGWYIDEVKIQATMLLVGTGPTVVDEGSLFAYPFGSPCQNLRFSLGTGAPAGVNIDPVLGIVTWVPTEEQGPGNYPIQVCVTEVERPDDPVDCTTLEVTVLESNSAPVLDAIEPKLIQENVPLQFTVFSYDLDRPVQNLTFSLEQGAPFGATIDSSTGLFSWTPTPTQATTRHTVSVRVTDDGQPPQSALATFTASPAGPVTEVRLRVNRLTPELITICMEGGVVGVRYSLETATGLNGAPEWTVLQTIWKGEDNYCETTHASVSVTRFYRLRRVQ